MQNSLRLWVFLATIFCLQSFAFGQGEGEKLPEKSNYLKEHFELGGYIKYMNTNSFRTIDTIFTDNLIHNRLNFKYNPNQNFRISLELRNRLFYGESVKYVPNYAEFIDQDAGTLDLSFNLIESGSVILNSTIDRANIEFNKNKWNIQLGRQRINWGMNLAWNPNDLFNAYNFVDFDYQERPGSDALRIRYYNQPMSQIELAYRPGKDLDHTILAGMYKFNTHGYDIQLIGANYLEDVAAGIGFAGNIKGAGFKGEATYFHPKTHLADTIGALVTSISSDYTFKNGIYVNAAVLFNSAGSRSTDFRQFTTSFTNLSAKNLMPTRFAGFVSISKSISPIFSTNFSAMYLPEINGLFAIPTLSYSILENWDLDAVGQLLFANTGSRFGNVRNALFFRLRWSF